MTQQKQLDAIIKFFNTGDKTEFIEELRFIAEANIDAASEFERGVQEGKRRLALDILTTYEAKRAKS